MPIDRDLAARVAKVLEDIAAGESPRRAMKKHGVEHGELGHLMERLHSAFHEDKKTSPRKKAAKGTLKKAVAFSDGGSRGNPGKAACAVVLFDDSGNELLRRAKGLGRATNNQAEYEGAIFALELAGQLGAKKLEIKMDSELVVRQLEGTYKVRNVGLKPYYARACGLVDEFQSVAVTHIPRAQNKLADKLVNACLDGKDLPED
jgi:ribonuclease HI